MRWLRLVLGGLAACVGELEARHWEQERACLHGDPRFSEAERLEVERGASWLYGQACLPPPCFAWDAPVQVVRERRGAAGRCSGGVVYLDPDDPYASPGTLRGLAAHELAHCVLGFVDGYRAEDQPSDGIMRVLDPMLWTTAEQAQCDASRTCCKS